MPALAGKDFQGKTKAGPHGDFIFEFDVVVGRLMKKLDDLGIADNTLVIVSSDNGPEVASIIAMRSDHNHDGARPWRGVKRDNWEGHWKYLDHQGSGGNRYERGRMAPFNLEEKAPDAPGQLYDLKADPGETNNLYFKNPEVVKRLKAKLDRAKESGRSAPKAEARESK